MFDDYPDVVNLSQLRKMLGNMCPQVATRLLKENRIHHFKVGRIYYIPKKCIIEFLSEEINKS